MTDKKAKSHKQMPQSSWQKLFALSIMGEMVEVTVEGYSGPVDALLELIDQNQLDITALSLAEVTDQYWKSIESSELEPDVLAEFITLGSKLLYIKSCALLPGAREPAADLKEELDAATEELTHLLEEHKRFKDAFDLFRQLEEEGRRTFARTAPVRNVPLPPGLEGVTLDTLLSAVKEALARTPAETETEVEQVIQIEPVTVSEKINEITGKLTANKGRLPFRPLLAACKTRTEIVVLFLAVLELIKDGHLWAEQETAFGEIDLIETTEEQKHAPEEVAAESRLA
jgi:segregation and condensation protein A